MVSDAILGALVGGGAAVAGSFVQAYFARQNTKDRIRAQNERQQAQFFAGQKVQALAQLHSALIDCRRDIGHQLVEDGPMLSEQEVETQIWPLIRSLQTAQDRASIFLDDEQQQAVQDAFEQVNEASQYIKAAAQGGVTEGPAPVAIDELAEETQKAMNVLEEEISGPIEKFESD